MNAYLDTSVFLRRLFGEPAPFAGWAKIQRAYTSQLAFVEMSRTLQRGRLTGKYGDEEMASLVEEAAHFRRAVNIVALTRGIVARATGSFATVVATLNALHIATALAAQTAIDGDLVFVTHDAQQARAARASGLTVA